MPISADDKVIHAFLDARPASSRKLTSTGSRLDGNWMGGTGIAEWSSRGRIHLFDQGSKAAQTVQRKIARIAPRNWFEPTSEWILPKQKRVTNPVARPYRASVESFAAREIKEMTERNAHGDALLYVVRNVLRSPVLTDKVQAINREHMRIGYMPHDLSTERYRIYKVAMRQLQRRASKAEYEAVYGAT